MSVQAFLETIIEELASKFPGVASCEVYPGAFTADELKRAAVKTPAARLAAYEVIRAELDASGEVDMTVGLSLVIITTDKRGLPRASAGLNLVEAIALMLAQGEVWGANNVFSPERVAARNLYSPELSKTKVQIWEISWRQTIRLGAPYWADDGVMPTTLYVGQAPRIGADHVDDYEVIEGEDA